MKTSLITAIAVCKVQNGANDVHIAISGDGTSYTIIRTNTFAQKTGTTSTPTQDFFTPTSD